MWGGAWGAAPPPGEIGQAAKGPRPLQMCMRTVLSCQVCQIIEVLWTF